jgi:hypothetical protein
MDTTKTLIAALILGLIVGYIVGANPSPTAIVTNPVGAIQTAINTL